jgi:arylsulfatase A-like enzyme
MLNPEHNKKSQSRLTRRDVIKYGLYGGLSAGLLPVLLSCAGEGQYTKFPNIIVISIDTLRADHLGCYGYGRATSPTLEKFASKSMLFEDTSAPSPWTLPSHGSLLTGLYPSSLGLTTKQNALPSDAKTLARILSKYNFDTGAFVNGTYVSKKFGFNKGFDTFEYIPNPNDAKGTAPMIIRLVKKWLDRHQKKQFFLFVHFFDVHSNYSSLPYYEKQFTGPYEGVFNGSTQQLKDVREGKLSLDNSDAKHLIDLYDAGIRQLDDRLKVLFDFLEQKGLLENSYVVITSDHGEEFLEHGGILHSKTHYQEVMHVPLIIRGPKIPPGLRIKEIVSLVDVMPTILGLLGIPSLSGFDGYDLRPLWQESCARLPERFVFAEADIDNVRDNIKLAVRSRQHKLHYDILSKKIELYNLAEDPQELTSIYHEHTALSKLLFQELRNFMQSSTKKGQKAAPLSPEELQRLKSLGYL